jgi:hypothetical protein
VIGAVVPVCNRRDNLELLLASLEIQTLDDFAIVADDGSTDGTRDLVLRAEAMSLFQEAHREHPDVVLFGMVERLPPLDHIILRDAVRRRDLPSLRARVPHGKPVRVEGTFTGPELRGTLVRASGGHPRAAKAGLSCMNSTTPSLTTTWSLKTYRDTEDTLSQTFNYHISVP